MPRIYKGNKVTMKLLIRKCFDDVEISELKIALFTNDPNMAIEFTDRYTIDGNIATLEVPNYAFGSLEDGVINYIAQGLIGDETFITERQSNYYLKTPIDFVPGDGIPEEIKTEEFETTITENGIHTFEPEGDVEAWSKATITVDVPTEEGGSCNLGEGEIFLTTNDAGTYEMYASDEGYDGWSKFIVTLEGGGAIKIHKASDLLDFFNNGGNIDYGAYYYVGGEITEIQEVSTQYGNATYTLDNGFKVYRGKWIDGNGFDSEDQIKVGAYIVVYGVIGNYQGTLQFNAGSQVIAYQECEGNTPNPEPIPPQDGWGMVGYFNEWGGTPDIPFEENGEWEGRPYKVIRDFSAIQGEFKIRLNNAWDNSYTANFYNEPQFAKLQKGDWNMPIDDGVWDIYLFFGDNGEPDEMLILYADTDLYSLQYEYTLNVSTNIQNTIIFINNPYSGMVDQYFGGSATVTMKYGNTYTIMTWMEGYEGITEELTCYNNEDRYYTLTKIESGDCNIQDYKWVRPSMADKAENGDIYIYPDEGYDAVGYIDLDPNDIYNEGYDKGVIAGKAESGGLNLGETYIGLTENERGQTFELIPSNDGYDAYSKVTVELHNFDLGGGSCNLGTLDMTLTDPYTVVKDASEDGYDGYNQVIVRPDNIIAQEKENAINEFKNQMQEITITENGTYSIDDTELVKSIAFDGNSYFDTGIVPTENIKIEVCIKVTDGNDAGMGGIIIGAGIDPVDSANYNGGENRGIAIGMGGGAIYGVWGATRSYNNPYEYEKTTTVVLQKTDDSWGWEGEKGSFGTSTLYIGGYNRNGEEVEEKFTQSIVYIKIWTDRNDDSTLITYVPNTNGNFDANGAELQRLGDGTTTYVEEYVNIYPNGFKRVEVNVPSVQEQVNGYYYCPLILGDSGFGEAAKSWGTDMVTFNDSDGYIIEDKLYVPTYGNRNEFRTKTRATLIQTLKNVGVIGSIEFGSGVEKVYLYETSEFTNLTKLIIGKDVFTASLSRPTFPVLKEIWSYSTASNFGIDVNFNSGGTLYLKNKDHETEWRNKLPSDWTIVYI